MMTGLSSVEAKKVLEKVGYNELPSAQPKNIWKIALEVFREPMFVLLITCGSLYIFLGDYQEGIILLCTIFIIIFITFYQYRKTERALEALRKLSSPRTLVIRDGVETRIPGREVVPDDIMLLNEGDRVSADAELIEAGHLMIDESLLTGESVPVVKVLGATDTNQQSQVFSGTLVVHGKGVAKVTNTGIRTEFGKIGTSIEGISQDQTRLQKEMKILIRTLFLIGIIVSVGIVILYYYTRGHFIESLLNGLAATIAILPEEFPVVLTIFMALGAWHLSRKNVLTRRPSAIESLGAATVLCSDKTGTITLNKMEVAAMYNGHKIFNREDFCHHTKEIRDVLNTAHRATHEGSIDPMEQAIHLAYEEHCKDDIREFDHIREYPWRPDFFAMTRVHKEKEATHCVVSAKGAPETIFTLCRMNTHDAGHHLEAIQELAAHGFRVLGVAGAITDESTLPDEQSGFHFSFKGLIAFEDPIRPEARQAIKECHEAGIRVIMMTGDYPVTAKNIAMQAGLPPKGKVITGDQLREIDDQTLKKKISRATVFARVVPEQKLRIVEALKANGEIVAMTGDGINDAPALKAADIGIAMGNKGTDVAREASSLVLLDDNFASIVAAIRSGRKIFDNLQKAMSYILAIHIPIIGLTMLPAFFPWLPVVMMPLHIVFLELIIDPACSIAFESEQEEKGIMQRPPRKHDERFFGGTKIVYSLFQGFLLLGMVLGVYFLSMREMHSEGEIRAITFSALIIGNIFLILTNLSKTRSVLAVILEKNLPAAFILSGALLMLWIILTWPPLQDVFSFQMPAYKHFLPAIVGALGMLAILEGIKWVRQKIISG